jgi:hypothetical protein
MLDPGKFFNGCLMFASNANRACASNIRLTRKKFPSTNTLDYFSISDEGKIEIVRFKGILMLATKWFIVIDCAKY